jgi:4-oxalocrotonate tautomerase
MGYFLEKSTYNRKKRQILKNGGMNMPFVHIELLEGRTPEQLEKMMKDVTRVISEDTGAPQEHISVIVNQLGERQLAQGGEWRTPAK